jgi:hypothetical protein
VRTKDSLEVISIPFRSTHMSVAVDTQVSSRDAVVGHNCQIPYTTGNATRWIARPAQVPWREAGVQVQHFWIPDAVGLRDCPFIVEGTREQVIAHNPLYGGGETELRLEGSVQDVDLAVDLCLR